MLVQVVRRRIENLDACVGRLGSGNRSWIGERGRKRSSVRTVRQEKVVRVEELARGGVACVRKRKL